MVTFTRNTNTVEVNTDGALMSVSPELSVNGLVGETKIYFSLGPLDYNRKNSVLAILISDIQGRPNNNAPDVAQWLADTYFSGLSGGGGGGSPVVPEEIVTEPSSVDPTSTFPNVIVTTEQSAMILIVGSLTLFVFWTYWRKR